MFIKNIKPNLKKWKIITALFEEEQCQEAFNRRLPVCCSGSVMNPLFLINSGVFRN